MIFCPVQVLYCSSVTSLGLRCGKARSRTAGALVTGVKCTSVWF